MAYDVSGTAGTVMGIAGMGIGLGLLAHTAKNVARSTDWMYDTPRRNNKLKSKYYKRKRTYAKKPRPIRLNVPKYW